MALPYGEYLPRKDVSSTASRAPRVYRGLLIERDDPSNDSSKGARATH
jgi:hypothetical protein